VKKPEVFELRVFVQQKLESEFSGFSIYL